MTRMIRNRNPPTADHCNRFELELARLLTDALEGRGEAHHYFDNQGWDQGGIDVVLAVDYHPCPLLLVALEAAGIERNVRECAALPLKTVMKVSARRILLGDGYRAPWREIYGPAWGASYEDHRRASELRGRAIEAMHAVCDEQRITDVRGYDWAGPVPA